MTVTCQFLPARRSPSVFASVLSAVLAGTTRLTRALRHRREAGMLAGMDDRMLADIGLNRSDLRDAYAEPLWRDPTDMLADRAHEKRHHRRRRLEIAPLQAPSLAPDETCAAPSAGRPAHTTPRAML